MSRLSILDRLYMWWGRWDVSNLDGRRAAPVDHTVILTCGSKLSQLTRSIPPMFGFTCWSHGGPYVCGLTIPKVSESMDLNWLSKISQGNKGQGSCRSTHL